MNKKIVVCVALLSQFTYTVAKEHTHIKEWKKNIAVSLQGTGSFYVARKTATPSKKALTHYFDPSKYKFVPGIAVGAEYQWHAMKGIFKGWDAHWKAGAYLGYRHRKHALKVNYYPAATGLDQENQQLWHTVNDVYLNPYLSYVLAKNEKFSAAFSGGLYLANPMMLPIKEYSKVAGTVVNEGNGTYRQDPNQWYFSGRTYYGKRFQFLGTVGFECEGQICEKLFAKFSYSSTIGKFRYRDHYKVSKPDDNATSVDQLIYLFNDGTKQQWTNGPHFLKMIMQHASIGVSWKF